MMRNLSPFGPLAEAHRLVLVVDQGRDADQPRRGGVGDVVDLHRLEGRHVGVRGVRRELQRNRADRLRQVGQELDVVAGHQRRVQRGESATGRRSQRQQAGKQRQQQTVTQA